MKDIEYIEELLNSYIDGELDERKTNEISSFLIRSAAIKN